MSYYASTYVFLLYAKILYDASNVLVGENFVHIDRMQMSCRSPMHRQYCNCWFCANVGVGWFHWAVDIHHHYRHSRHRLL